MPSAGPANPIYGVVYAAAGDKHLRARMVCSNPIGQLTLCDLSARAFSVALLAAVVQSRRVNEFCLCPSTQPPLAIRLKSAGRKVFILICFLDPFAEPKWRSRDLLDTRSRGVYGGARGYASNYHHAVCIRVRLMYAIHVVRAGAGCRRP
jgi:hypothetical protein